MKIALVGGGTAGSVFPLIAVAQLLKKENHGYNFLFLGTRKGIEREIAGKNKFDFYWVPSGKWRKHFSLKNLTDIFVTLVGFIKAFFLLRKHRPAVVFSAGSFVSVPVAYAAKLLGIKIIIHQQDVLPGLSNKLIYPIADRLTVSVPESQKFFFQGSGILKRRRGGRKKIKVTGNPVRDDVCKGNEARARKIFNLSADMPVLLVLGGSSGAEKMNKLVYDAVQDHNLCKYFQTIHVTGQKSIRKTLQKQNYHSFGFLTDQLADALKVSDIVISRAGFSTITELAACKKLSVIIPMPQSHQEVNGQYLFIKRAAAVLRQSTVTPENLVAFLRKLLFEYNLQRVLKKNIGDLLSKRATEKVAAEVLSLVEKD